MICDADFCTLCDEDADNRPSPTEGLPWVHSSDTTRTAKGITFFTPKHRHYNNVYMSTSYLRRVRFQTEDGEVSVIARVCGYKDCDTCEARSLAAMKKLMNAMDIDVPDEAGDPVEGGETAGLSERAKGKRRVTFAPGTFAGASASASAAPKENEELGDDEEEEEGQEDGGEEERG